jgi:hypothetical protein
MIALLLCVIGALAAFFVGRRSLAAGCLVVAASGYAYGILRANLVTPVSHFIFDAALIGLYAAQFLPNSKKLDGAPPQSGLRTWVLLLMGWPLVLVFLPFQPLLVSIVGLRGNMFLLPAALIGSRLRSKDLRVIALGLAVLNLVAMGFAIAEYFRGIEPFFPVGPMTITIYNSQDSGGGYRIPSLFQNAHTYGGVMVDTIPFLFGAWALTAGTRKQKMLLVAGLVTAFFGILMAATRVGLISAFFMVIIAATGGKLGAMKRWIWLVVIVGVVFAALHNDRWQRYKELDTDTISDRIAGSVNRSFLEILVEYPMGNGLGGGGTSIPYFLASQVNHPVGVENEYGRILLEEGIVGLLLWIGFGLWLGTNRAAFVKDEWYTGRRMAWYFSVFTLATAVIGVGLLSSVPHTFFFMLLLGWSAVPPLRERQPGPIVIRRPAPVPVMG